MRVHNSSSRSVNEKDSSDLNPEVMRCYALLCEATDRSQPAAAELQRENYNKYTTANSSSNLLTVACTFPVCCILLSEEE